MTCLVLFLGGIDLRFPHHENEEAQSCAYFDTNQWVNYWFHTGHLHLSNDEKMSKSLKNTVSIQELAQNTSSDAFRMACAMSHYRANMEFSSEVINTAESYIKKIKTFLNECENYVNGLSRRANINENELLEIISESNKNITEALKDDFNTAKVIKIIIDLITATNKMLASPIDDLNINNSGIIIVISHFVRDQLNVFGFDLDDKRTTTSEENVDNILDLLNVFRQNVRNYGLEKKNKEILKLCDDVRTALKEQKIVIQDFGKVSSWNRE